MKILSLLFLTFLSLNFTTNKIAVKIHFENKSNLPSEKGVLIIKETKQNFEITSFKDFEINLEEGKYHFSFESKTDAIVVFPKKIDSKNRTVQIILTSKNNSQNQNIATSENIENIIKTGDAKFISFGIAMQDFTDFEKKYKIGLKTQGCVIDSFSSKRAIQNNTFLAKYLTAKYGISWRKDLPFLPFGLN